MKKPKDSSDKTDERQDDIEGLRKANEKLANEYEELKVLLQRNHAEFQNYIKRVDEEKKKFVSLANESLILELLSALDHFELALRQNPQSEQYAKGIEMIYSELKNLLSGHGVEPIPAIGRFDANQHEALIAEESEKEPGTIMEELQKGYKLAGKIIRASKVKIAKQKQDNQNNQGGVQE